MNDRELIHNAAKAAGIVLAHGRNVTDIHPSSVHYLTAPYWEPLTDDGDRYRLIKALNMRIDFEDKEVVYWVGPTACFEDFDDGDDARAVLRAAAAIGAAL